MFVTKKKYDKLKRKLTRSLSYSERLADNQMSLYLKNIRLQEQLDDVKELLEPLAIEWVKELADEAERLRKAKLDNVSDLQHNFKEYQEVMETLVKLKDFFGFEYVSEDEE